MAIFDWECGRNSAPRDGQKRPCHVGMFSCVEPVLSTEDSFNPAEGHNTALPVGIKPAC